jgi:hypothetical protein
MSKINGKTRNKTALCAAMLLPALGFSSTATLADDFVDALAKSKVSGNFRLRYEDVDVDSTTVKDASALTLRSRLGVETAPLAGFTGVLEFSNTTVLGDDDYAPESAGYAAIVDPSMTVVDRAYLRYRGVDKLDLGLGRQRIVLDNHRFIGNVGWRQNEQTFDAFTANYTGVANWTFMYAYIDGVNGIADAGTVGGTAYNFDIDSSDNLFNISYAGFKAGKITAYYYLLDNSEPDAALRNIAPHVNALNPSLRYQSNDTYGIRFDGSWVLASSPVRLLYTAEYARQEYTSPTDVEFEPDYSLIDIGAGYAASFGVLSLRVAQESLGSDTVGTAQQGFQTPYATKHAFNGWTDMFLNTPATGLDDQYVTAAADLASYGVKLAVVYHRYEQSDAPVAGGGTNDFGSEWNVQALKQFGPNYTLGIKYGKYEADEDVVAATNIDTTKFWIWGELNF